MSDNNYKSDVERLAQKIGQEFSRQFAAYTEEEKARSQALQEGITAILDKVNRIPQLEADVAELKSEVKTTKFAVKETNFDLKAVKQNLDTLNKRTEKLDEYKDDFENHEVRIIALEQARAA